MNLHMSGFKKVAIIVVLIIAFAVWGAFSELFFSYPVTNFPPQGSLVMVWGDSLSVGVGATTPEKGYVGVLKDRLSLSLINKAVSGETTSGTLLHAASDLAEIKPNIVMILLGGNDLLSRTPTTETFANLRKLIDLAHEGGAVVLLVGFQKRTDDNYANGFALLAKSSGTVYVADVLGNIIGDPLLMADEIHPNDKGYLKMADKIAPDLEGLVLSGAAAGKPAHD